MGQGPTIMAGVVINSDSKKGENVILNIGFIIETFIIMLVLFKVILLRNILMVKKLGNAVCIKPYYLGFKGGKNERNTYDYWVYRWCISNCV